MFKMRCGIPNAYILDITMYKMHVSLCYYCTGWRRADWHISNLNSAPARQLVVVGGKGNDRGEDAISYGQWQWNVGISMAIYVRGTYRQTQIFYCLLLEGLQLYVSALFLGHHQVLSRPSIAYSRSWYNLMMAQGIGPKHVVIPTIIIQ